MCINYLKNLKKRSKEDNNILYHHLVFKNMYMSYVSIHIQTYLHTCTNIRAIHTYVFVCVYMSFYICVYIYATSIRIPKKSLMLVVSEEEN